MDAVALAHVLMRQSFHAMKVGPERRWALLGQDIQVYNANTRPGGGPGIQRLEPLLEDLTLHIIRESPPVSNSPQRRPARRRRRCLVGPGRSSSTCVKADALETILMGQWRQVGQRARDAHRLRRHDT